MSKVLCISELFIHPVKSLTPISIETTLYSKRGMEKDRRWMMVDQKDRFISQRSHPILRLCRLEEREDGYEIITPSAGSAAIPIELTEGLTISTWMFDDQPIFVTPFDGDANELISELLGEPIRFCYQREDHIRPCDPNFSQEGDAFSLADGYPILVVNQASLEDLNSRMETHVEISRFRPNIVVNGNLDAWEEDHWTKLSGEQTSLRVVKPCARCSVSTVSSEGVFQKEPLRTLSGFRNRDGKVYFGMNIIPDHSGRISVGDHLSIETNSTDG